MAHVTGVRSVRLCVELRHACHHLRLLLCAYILHHQTSQQGLHWSRGSRRCHGDHATWSKRRGDAAADDWSWQWGRIVSHGVECSADHGHNNRLLRHLLVTGVVCQHRTDAHGLITFACMRKYFYLLAFWTVSVWFSSIVSIHCAVCLCGCVAAYIVCMDINQGRTIHSRRPVLTETCRANLERTDLLMNSGHNPKTRSTWPTLLVKIAQNNQKVGLQYFFWI